MQTRATFLGWLLACVGVLAAQEPGYKVYIDIGGTWKLAPGDNPAWAAADFDDSGWQTVTVPLPYVWSPGGRELWVRKNVMLPAGLAEGTPLTATIGTIRFGTYEVYLNGVRTEPTPAWDRTEFQVPRPRQFEFRSAGQRLVLALHVVPFPRLPAAWLSMEPGPWVVTSSDIAPRREGLHVLAWQRVHRVGDVAEALVLLSFALIVLVIWARQQDRREFLWLGLYMAMVAVGRTNLFVQIGPDAVTGWRFVSPIVGTLPMPFLAMFVAVWTRQRWLVWPCWVMAVIGLIRVTENNEAMFRMAWLIDLLLLAALGRHLFRKGAEDRYLVPIVVAVMYTHASSWLGLRDFGIPSLVQYNTDGWIPIGFVWHVIFTMLLAVVFTVVQVRRLLRDRDEKVRLTNELEAARNIQQLLFTDSTPGVEAIYRPAAEVGGDFYQVLDVGGGEVLVVVGDVSGKGLKAAMVVSLLVGAIRAHARLMPAALLGELNKALAGGMGGGFVTCVAARFASDGTGWIANAGHLLPYCDGRELEVAAGLPLGLTADAEYEEQRVGPGAYVLLSDGVVEAANAGGELFGFSRTLEVAGKPARDIANAAQAWGQNDDITVVTVRAEERSVRQG